MSPKARRNTPRKIARYGWIPDLPDSRDYFYAAPSRILSVLPPYVDLRPNCPAVYDQGDLGSCTANAIGASFQFEQKKQGIPDVVPISGRHASWSQENESLFHTTTVTLRRQKRFFMPSSGLGSRTKFGHMRCASLPHGDLCTAGL